MYIQKHSQELEKLKGVLFPEHTDTILVKVSDYVYQVWWEIALSKTFQEKSLEGRQKTMLEEVTKWAEHRYPEHRIAHVADYSSAEAAEIAARTGLPVTWGMYVLLQRRENLLNSGHNQIDQP